METRLPQTLLLFLTVGWAIPASAVDFASEIQPLLAEHCLECHGPDASKGGLNLESRTAALKVLKSGKHGITPGDPTRSAVTARVTTTDLEERMPPKEKTALTAAESALLKKWIEEGAVFAEHWAYRPLAAEEVKDEQAAAAKIDGLIKAELDKQGFKAVGAAEPTTLVKRVWYDLLGLPPQPEEVGRFIANAAKDMDGAYATLVDEALASPHFGERWGRHWLDAARYADSDGYEKDRPRPDAWRYRDWVINAVNQDLPFDQFTVDQLAGDLLPNATDEQIVATAFNRQTLTNTEGGTDQEQFRVEACMDRTETLGTVWLGLTVGCARCHTHKYDRISQTEYYQLFSFFNNADEVSRRAPESQEKWRAYEQKNGDAAKRLASLEKAVADAKAQLAAKLPAWETQVQAQRKSAVAKEQKFTPLKLTGINSESKTKFNAQPDASWLASGKVPKTDVYSLEIAASPTPVKALRLEVLTDASLPKKGPGRKDNGNFVLSELQVLVNGKPMLLHSPAADFTQKGFEAKGVLDSDDQTGWAVSGGVGKDHHLTVQLWEAMPAGSRFSVRLVQRYKQADHVIGKLRLSASHDLTPVSIVPSDVARILDEEPKRRNSVVIQGLWDFMSKVDADVLAATQALNKAKAELPAPPLMDVRVIAERRDQPRTTRLLLRGDFLQPTDPVQPAALGVLPVLKAAGQATRLDLARWLVSKDHPLTPRVVVNQMWSKLFGEGLVKTVGDFGVRGEKPSHPALLDFLARQFMKQGWSRKRLLRAIMLSQTYRRSSAFIETQREAVQDPLNRYLWRQNRLRVEGEIVRDLHLAASGLLSKKIGGPSVFPVMPPDIAALSYANNFKWTTSTGQDRYRRGLYTFFKRTAPHPDLTTFDCPDANTTNTKRTVSNTPLQALTTLNSETFTDAARALGLRALSLSTDDAAQLTHAFRLALGRQPSAQEIQALQQLLTEAQTHYKTHPEEAKTLAGSTAQHPESEIAAWTATARIILNTDELITRD
jgi:hypothetical protein